MTQQERIKTLVELEKATEEALSKVQEIANEFYDLVADLRRAVDESEERNLVGAFDLNLHYKCIFFAQDGLEAVQRVLKRVHMDMSLAEGGFGSVPWRITAYVQKAEIELAKIKAITSLVGITQPQNKTI